jgi:NAD(P)-dependent dehydrogenase (short-subunit alcohol dehydrogenase family)
MQRWTSASIPALTGRSAVVTGASSGIGLEAALELARHGADVTVAVRDRGRGQAALDRIESALARVPGRGALTLADLDLASLGSVRDFAGELLEAGRPLHLLVNNAGVMAIPQRTTADGFEMQLGTNHLGHMALTLGLLPALARTGAGGATTRVVTVSSNVHKIGRIDLADLQSAHSYKPWAAYGQSKLANLMFALELQRRLDSAALPVASYAAHPGFAATNLQSVGPAMRGRDLEQRITELGTRVLGQSAAMGALPTLYAATVPGLPPGSYIGPDGLLAQRGHPAIAVPSSRARDEAMAARLWEASEALIGVRFDDVVAAI